MASPMDIVEEVWNTYANQLQTAYQLGKKEKRERGGVIYRTADGSLGYTQAGVAVGDSAINMEPARAAAAQKGTVVLEFHTHPDTTEAASHPSQIDIKIASGLSHTMLVLTHNKRPTAHDGVFEGEFKLLFNEYTEVPSLDMRVWRVTPR